MTDTYWRDHAACSGADPRLFDEPSRDESPSDAHQRIQRATAICAGCPVRNECLTEAIRCEDTGIRGGVMRQYALGRNSGEVVTRANPLRAYEPCGTYGAYQRHRRWGEPIDPDCQAAHTRQRAKERANARARRAAE